MFCFWSPSFSPSLRQHSQWRPPWQRVPVWHSVHTWATWAQAWAWCLSCCPVLPCWFLGVPPAWQPWPTAPPHKNICAQTSWRYAACVQLCCVAMFGLSMMKGKCWLVLPLTLARFVENSSAVTARGARVTAAMLTPWRLAWWTAVKTRWSSAWTTLKVAAAETSASTSIPRLTCRQGSRLRSTKPVKTQRLQPWWVLLNSVTGNISY